MGFKTSADGSLNSEVHNIMNEGLGWKPRGAGRRRSSGLSFPTSGRAFHPYALHGVAS